MTFDKPSRQLAAYTLKFKSDAPLLDKSEAQFKGNILSHVTSIGG